jgi:hypothetical protein
MYKKNITMNEISQEELNKIPVIVNESKFQNNMRMLSIVIVIIFFIFILMKIKEPIIMVCPQSKSLDKVQIDGPVLGQFVQIMNINSVKLPIRYFMIMDQDNKIHKISISNCQINFMNSIKKGISIIVPLHKEIWIKQIIVESDVFSSNVKNLNDCLVYIRNKDRDVTWIYDGKLLVEKYNTIKVVRDKIKYVLPLERVKNIKKENVESYLIQKKIFS